jgi:hypothetical protein
MVRAPSARRGAFWFALDAVAWVANLYVLALFVTGAGGYSMTAWTWVGAAVSAVVVVGIPVSHYRLYRRARRIINGEETVR